MYGGVGEPAPVAAPPPAFSGFGYDSPALYTSLNNYLLAAYSIKLAANAIRDTSMSQNLGTTTGTRYLQRNSSVSFTEATQTINNSLTNLYKALNNNIDPTLVPAAAPPPLAPPPM